MSNYSKGNWFKDQDGTGSSTEIKPCYYKSLSLLWRDIKIKFLVLVTGFGYVMVFCFPYWTRVCRWELSLTLKSVKSTPILTEVNFSRTRESFKEPCKAKCPRGNGVNLWHHWLIAGLSEYWQGVWESLQSWRRPFLFVSWLHFGDESDFSKYSKYPIQFYVHYRVSIRPRIMKGVRKCQ